MGTINVVSTAQGDPTWVQDSFAAFNQPTTVGQSYSPTDGNKASQIRLIGGGFEVHNDTAELFKSGSVTVYSSANDWSEPQLSRVDTESAGTPFFGLTTAARYPPVLSTDAALYTDARTWSASEGCYVPLRFDLDCPSTKFMPRNTSIPLFREKEDGTPGSTSGFMTPYSTQVDFRVGPGELASYFVMDTVLNNGWLQAPIETTGSFFSGLSPETVLTLDMRFITELAPTAANPALLSLCSPSAHYDPRAMECYTNCLLTLPPGVPVSMNEKGDFWRMAIKAAKAGMTIATPIATAMGPGQASAAVLANLALDAAQRVADKRGPKKAAAPRTKGVVSRGNNAMRK